MVSIAEAQRIILRHVRLVAPETVPLLQALNRVTSEDHLAPRDMPPADLSAMDGFAFSSARLTGSRLKVTGFLPAGDTCARSVQPGEAVRIMTGAPLPPGCDTVVPIEEVETEGEWIRLVPPVAAGSHIRRQGEELRQGSVALASGTLLRPQEIGLLSAMGKSAVAVYRRPRVAILATGDELLEPGAPPPPGKIVNSNSYSLAAQVLAAGGEPVLLGIAADTEEATREKIQEGLRADILITTGGVSVGDRDLVRETLIRLGGEILFWKVDMKPGKPVAFALLGERPVFALPGNPVAAMVGFEMFVRPALLSMMGHHRIFRPRVTAVLAKEMHNRGSRPHLVRVQVAWEKGRYHAVPAGSQSSASLTSLTRSNGLLYLPPSTSQPAGAEVEVTLLDKDQI